jgi:hypothetical protein
MAGNPSFFKLPTLGNTVVGGRDEKGGKVRSQIFYHTVSPKMRGETGRKPLILLGKS